MELNFFVEKFSNFSDEFSVKYLNENENENWIVEYYYEKQKMR